MRCIVDCRVDRKLANNYLELSLWGKPCFAYVIEAVRESECFSNIKILTDRDKIFEYCKRHYPNVEVTSINSNHEDGEMVFAISGRAPCISASTIKDAVNSVKKSVVVSSQSASKYDFSQAAISFYSGVEHREFNAFSISGGH